MGSFYDMVDHIPQKHISQKSNGHFLFGEFLWVS